MTFLLTPELVLEAYAQGIFPMAEKAGRTPVYWISPQQRGQLSIPELHIPRKLRSQVRKFPFEIRIDTAFEEVIDGCAESAPGRPETWINETIREIFLAFYEMGHAHSVECWQEEKLVGGLYGLRIGGAFFGESMFSRESNASKVALVHLTARLWKGGFEVLDTQWVNDHLLQFGCYEIPRQEYLESLNQAMKKEEADFTADGLSERALIRDYLASRGFGG